VSVDGTFGEHVIITTGGGEGTHAHPSSEKIKENYKIKVEDLLK